jgi:hypothetical protein
MTGLLMNIKGSIKRSEIVQKKIKERVRKKNQGRSQSLEKRREINSPGQMLSNLQSR